MKDEYKALIIMLGIALIMSIWGLTKYAGVGLIFAGVYDGIKEYLKYSKKKGATK
jgi:hypothetical protein